MPVQKGKKNRRVRRRGVGSAIPGAVGPNNDAPSRPSRAVPARRRAWEFPLPVNIAIGVGFVVLGIVFTLIPQKGTSTRDRLLMLGLYCLVAAFYLVKAYRQWRKARAATEGAG